VLRLHEKFHIFNNWHITKLFCISCTLLTLALRPVLQNPNCHCGKYPVKNPLSSHWQYHRHLLVSQWKPPTADWHAKQSNEFNGIMLLLNYTIKATLQKSKLASISCATQCVTNHIYPVRHPLSSHRHIDSTFWWANGHLQTAEWHVWFYVSSFD